MIDQMFTDSRAVTEKQVSEKKLGILIAVCVMCHHKFHVVKDKYILLVQKCMVC